MVLADRRLRVLVAPDKFKRSLTAEEAAEAIRLGVLDFARQTEVEICPLADGGEGSGALIAAAIGATERRADVMDPLGRSISARWWITPDGATAIIEMAEASGLQRLAPDERDPMRASSFGTGQLIAAALDAGASGILLSVGGSATVDGGIGALRALGLEINGTSRGSAEPLGGGALLETRALTWSAASLMSRFGRADGPVARRLTILCDVRNPACGPSGAAAAFGPQKGATPEEVARLDAGLAHWLRLLQHATGRDCVDVPGGGAAGGIAAGLAAALGATLVSGFEEIARLVALERRINACDACITGEGRLDAGSRDGKVVGGVAKLAHRSGKPVFAAVGSLDPALSATELRELVGLDGVFCATPPGAEADLARPVAAARLRSAVADGLASHPLFAAGRGSR